MTIINDWGRSPTPSYYAVKLKVTFCVRGVLSPLLSNVYMRRFVLGWKHRGYDQRFGAQIVTYADDLVICCKRGAEEALPAMRQIMSRLKLTVNEEKTHVCRVPEQYFNFLGYTFGRFYSTKTGRAYLGTRPSKKSVRRMIATISECTDRSTTGRAVGDVVQDLNRKLRGWANYFKWGPVSKAYQVLDRHTTQRLSRWLCIKHKVRGARHQRYSAPYLQHNLGLIRLPRLTQRLPWAKA